VRFPDFPDHFQDPAVLAVSDYRIIVEVTDTRVDRRRVIKSQRRPFGDEDQTRLREEFLLLDRVEHPYWPRPLEYGRARSGEHFFSQERAPGVPLSQLPLGRGKSLDSEKLEIARRILSGLDALHRLGYAHIDLKPEQIIVDRGPIHRADSSNFDASDLEVALLDLGLAARVGQTISARGTPGFTAPEVFLCRPWDTRADIYSLGMILHWLFSGEYVYPGSDGREVLQQQLDNQAGQMSPQLSPPMTTLVKELVSQDPIERPKEAWEIWRRLQDAYPTGHAGDVEVGLTGSPDFTLHGRESEIEEFLGWIRGVAMSRTCREAVCVITGEPGIGARRLAARLVAIAQTVGWGRESLRDWSVDRFNHNSRAGVETDPVEYRLLLHPETERIEAEKDRCELRILACTRVPREFASVRRTHRIRLAPLDETAMLRMAKGWGIESNAVAGEIARMSVGNPGLLRAMAKETPDLLQIDNPLINAEGIESQVSVPKAWIRWLESQLRGEDESVRDSLSLLAFLDDERSLDQSRSLLDVDFGTLASDLAPLLDRRVLRAEGSGVRFASPWWRDAVFAVDPERTKRVGTRLLGLLESAGSSMHEEITRLAIRVQDWERVSKHLPPALLSLHENHRYEDEVRLLGLAGNSAPAGTKLVSVEVLQNLIGGIHVLGGVGGQSLPAQYADSGPPECPGTGLAAVVRSWKLLADRSHVTALEVLEEGCSEEEDPRVDEAQMWLKGWLLPFLGQPQDLPALYEDFRSRLRETSPGVLERVKLLEFHCLSEAGQYPEARKVIDTLDLDSGVLGPADRALGYSQRARFDFQFEAASSAVNDDIGRAQKLFNLLGFQARSISCQTVVAGLDFEAGRLKESTELVKNLFQWRWSRASWVSCAQSLGNLSRIACLRGQLGDAVRNAANARRFTMRSRSSSARIDALEDEAAVMVWIGQNKRARELVDQIQAMVGDSSHRPLLSELTGISRLQEGDLENGRKILRNTLTGYQSLGMNDDAADLIVTWLLAESDHNERTEALSLYSDAETVWSDMTYLTRSRLLLAQSEMSAKGWLDVDEIPGGAESLLQASLDDIHRMDLGFFRWRGHWRLAQLHRRAGRSDESAREYQAAGAHLLQLVQTLDDDRFMGAFLDMPAPRDLAEEIADV